MHFEHTITAGARGGAGAAGRAGGGAGAAGRGGGAALTGRGGGGAAGFASACTGLPQRLQMAPGVLGFGIPQFAHRMYRTVPSSVVCSIALALTS
ncbi:MAG: hypothetical protein ABSB82_17210 [Terriglobia bacterium]